MAKKPAVSGDTKKSLLDRIKSKSSIKDSAILSESIFFNERDVIHLPVPMMNVALSGEVDKGFVPGLTMWAGPSRHFKSLFSLIMIKAYMDKYPDAVCIFYDSEFGSPKSYFESLNIDMNRIVHNPVYNLEQLKFDLAGQLDELERGDHVIIFVDSIGNLASKKELNDALKQNEAADMTRAKEMKSFWRIITPQLNGKNIPMVVVNHIYMTMEMYAKAIVSGGQGGMLAADNVYILGKQQEKIGEDDNKILGGYHFIINVEKSRFVKEKSKIPITVMFEGGLSKWSGLLDIAVASGHVIKPKKGFYQKVDLETGELLGKELKEDKTNTDDFWQSIVSNQSFKDFVKDKYQLSHGNLLQSDETEDAHTIESIAG